MGIITKGAADTKKLGAKLAKKILKAKKSDNAFIIALCGNLGSGKTTFIQGLAKGLGIKDKITSPTFVILKRFQFKKSERFKNFFHIDCYRIIKPEELYDIGWRKIIYNPENIVAIEWADLIKKLVPKSAVKIKIEFIDEKKRKLTMGNNIIKF